MNKYILLSILALVISSFSTQAFACAHCRDTYPEFIVFNYSSSKTLKKQNKVLFETQQKIDIRSISCTKQNIGTTKKYGETVCSIQSGDSKAKDMKLEGGDAKALFNRIELFTVELDYGYEKRSGERVKAAMINQSLEESTVTISPIGRGAISCYNFNGYNRCEIEINELHSYGLP